MPATELEAPGLPYAEIPHAAAHVVGARKWVLLVSLGVVFFMLLALYCAVMLVLLPDQIQALDPGHKAANLALMFALTSICSTITTPVAGALSDRTLARRGRRLPWILGGSLIGAASLFCVSQMTGYWAITGFWLVAVITLNAMQASITTIVADRFPEAERGKVSGFVGGGMTAGGFFGITLAGMLAAHMVLAYAVVSGAIAIVCVAFVIINPEPRLQRPDPGPFHLGAFARSFWVSPRQHPDFAWAFLGRFTIYMGYQAINTYVLYILEDYIHLSVAMANKMIAALSVATFCAVVVSGFSSGFISDATGRRKPIVFIASFIMGLAVTVPLIVPSMQGMYWYAVLLGLGYGAFMSVDMALMTQVLPKRDGEAGRDTGKDLGILTTAINVPQILSPVLAAWLLHLSGNDYRILFVTSLSFIFVGSLFVLPIRSVK